MAESLPTPTFPSVLLMLALDRRDPGLLDAVAALADPLGVKRVLVAHVYVRDPFPAWMVEGLPIAEVQPVEPPGDLQVAIQRLQKALPDREIVGVHATGDPAEELVRILRQEDVDLLAIGRNPSEDGQPGWGPSGQKLLRAAGVSALVVPVGARVDLSRVVVGIDFSRRAAIALRLATRLSPNVEAVFEYDHRSLGLETHSADEFDAQIRDNTARHFEQEILPQLEGARPTLVVQEGRSAPEVIIRRAQKAPIVVGSRGLTRFAVRLLGSTAEQVAGYAEGPVLIVRKKGESLGLIESLVRR